MTSKGRLNILFLQIAPEGTVVKLLPTADQVLPDFSYYENSELIVM
jgi:hypothetical protein